MKKNNQMSSGEMNYSNKKIKLDPFIVKKELQQDEEAEGKDGMYSVEEVLVQTRDESIELEPERFFIKEEIEEEQVVLKEEDMGENDVKSHETNDGNLSLKTEDNAGSKSTMVKSDQRMTVRDFMCTICNYVTKKLIQFTSHWLSHEEQSYTTTNGVYVCQISDCNYVALNNEDFLKHIASQHLYRYLCDFCYYVTYTEKDYDLHRTTHYTYQCTKCDLQSTEIFFVQDHVEAPLKCKICDFTAHHWFLYKKHIIWHCYSPDSIVKCGFCDFATGDQTVLRKHTVAHFSKFMTCKMCKFAGIDIAELAEHCKSIHDTTPEAVDKLHKCKFCTCKFIGIGAKKKHEELHLENDASLKCCSNSTTIQCPYCIHQEKQRGNLHSHIVSKHAPALELEGFRFENTSDQIAPKGTVLNDLEEWVDGEDESEEHQDKQEAEQGAKIEEKKMMIDHIAEDQENEELNKNYANKTSQSKSKPIFRCAFCPFTTTHRDLFDTHLTVHRAPKHIEITQIEQEVETEQYTCSFCYDVTHSKEDYDDHCKTHTTFKCTKCQFESTKKLFVEDHIENPWGCSKCKFKAHHWLLMEKHSFSHHNQGLPILKCNECSFSTRSQGFVMKKHHLTHTRALLYCKMCMFRTIHQYILRDHYAKIHGGKPPDNEDVQSDERPYECDLCVCKFKQQVYLDKHRALHGENGPFRSKCSQCSKNQPVIRSEKVEEKTDSWRYCPYCSYEDEARYRMIDHLSRIHLNELETEGYRFDDGQTNELPPQVANSTGKVMSNVAVPQI